MRRTHVLMACASVVAVGCVSIAGIGDYEVDPSFGTTPEGGSVTETGSGNEAGPPTDSGTDSPSDAPTDVTSPSVGLSAVTASGTGVTVGRTGIITLVIKNAAGVVEPRAGAVVAFTAKNGTSAVTFGAVTDAGGGTYRATYTGVTQGTALDLSATIDGVALTTPPAKVRVVNVVTAGLVFALDAENADRAGNFGGKNCAVSALGAWSDLTGAALNGTLTNFDTIPCVATSGWNGTGKPDSPFRLTFDGIDDYVDFGTAGSISKQTIIAWVRKTGDGFTGTTGNGGLLNVTPIFSKGTAEGEMGPIDINFYLGIADTGELATDYEAAGTSANFPLKGATVLAKDTWYMVAMTLDAAAAERFLFVNGKQDGTSTITVAPAGGVNAPLMVGGARRTDGAGAVTCPGAAGSTGCGRFKGDIAGVLAYNRALTATEIERNCHALSSSLGILSCPN